jgi:protein-S-isoprenylcysteine O-methyltransferase Ste14
MLRWAGGACLLAAWWIMFLALQDMGLSYRLGVDEQNPGRLVTKGIFAYSRNPVYLGIEIFFLGQFLLFPNGFFFWMILGTMVFLHYMIIKEEQRLLAFHHAAYASYHGRVPRYFGFKRRNR